MPGFVVWEADQVHSVWTLHIVDDRITAIHAVRNPDKLRRVGHHHP
jgi:hypothetical protein